MNHLPTTTCQRMQNHGHEEKVKEEEGCEEVIRIPFDTCENPNWCSAKAAGRKSGRFTFGWGFLGALAFPKPIDVISQSTEVATVAP